MAEYTKRCRVSCAPLYPKACGAVGLRGAGRVKMATEEPAEDGRGDTAALVATLIVLLAIVILFLLFKFNLFNGGTSIPTRATVSNMLTRCTFVAA